MRTKTNKPKQPKYSDSINNKNEAMERVFELAESLNRKNKKLERSHSILNAENAYLKQQARSHSFKIREALIRLSQLYP